MQPTQEHVDILIVGAGLSGIGSACHLTMSCPDRTFVILEGRESLGGTWDLFRYPGIRSDSDMYTLGFSFRPWTDAKAVADGPSILRYIEDTAAEYDVARHIRYGHRVEAASWSSADSRWTVEAEHAGEPVRFTCGFLHVCSGYYHYETGYTPDFKGTERFRGPIVHPQRWPEDLDYDGKRIVMIGSGATAVTLLPEIAKRAAHVTMLQRSPTYMISRPDEDRLANWMRDHLSAEIAYSFTRAKNVLLQMFFFNISRRFPRQVKAALIDGVRRQLPSGYDIETHFTPSYDPWDQRVCLVPNGDLFEAIREGSASVVTDHIETITEHGIELKSGRELEADVIVTATGLALLPMGGMQLVVDDEPIELAQTLTYKGMMFSDVPNLALSSGYSNASWTLKCDLICGYVCRLLNHMKAHGYVQCTPRRNDSTVTEEPWASLTAGYIQRSLHEFPKIGSKRPWRLYENYARDVVALRHSGLEDSAMEFRRGEARRPVDPPAESRGR